MKSFVSSGMVSPYITDASDFPIRKVSLTQTQAEYPVSILDHRDQ